MIGALPAALASKSYCVAGLITGGIAWTTCGRFDGKSALLAGGAARRRPAASPSWRKPRRPGRAKTRLVPPLTFEEAAALNTAFLCDVADNVLLAAHHAAPHRRHCRLCSVRPDRRGGFLPPHLAGRDRLDRRLVARISAIACSTPSKDFRPRTRLGRGAQFRQPDAADGILDRDCGNAGAAGRSCRARSFARRRLLSARAQGRTPPHV